MTISKAARHIYLVLLLNLLLCLGMQAAEAAGTIANIDGTWDSKYGVIELKMEGQTKKGEAIVSGSYISGSNVAPIAWGRLENSVLKIEYYMKWQPLWGYAEFILDGNKGVMRGKYFQAGQSGEWILNRRGGGPIKSRSDLRIIANPATDRAPRIFSVEGKWDSTFGEVNLKGTSLAVVKQLNGSFTRPDGNVAKITFGSFMRQPGGGILKINYECPWNKSKGTAQFRPDQNMGGRMLVGVYNEGGKTGPWILCRPADYKF